MFCDSVNKFQLPPPNVYFYARLIEFDQSYQKESASNFEAVPALTKGGLHFFCLPLCAEAKICTPPSHLRHTQRFVCSQAVNFSVLFYRNVREH